MNNDLLNNTIAFDNFDNINNLDLNDIIDYKDLTQPSTDDVPNQYQPDLSQQHTNLDKSQTKVTSTSLTLNVKKHMYMLKIINKAISSSKCSYITIEEKDGGLYVYSESLLTGLKVIYQLDKIEQSFDFDFDDFEEEKLKFVVNASFINTLILINDTVNISIENEDVIIRSQETQITYSLLNQPTEIEDYRELLAIDYEDIIDRESVASISKSLSSMKEDAYKKCIVVSKNKLYTSNSNFIIENNSNYITKQAHIINYTILDIIKMFNKNDKSNLYMFTDELFTFMKYGDLYIRYENLGISRIDRLLDLVDMSRFVPAIKCDFNEFQKAKLLSQGGTRENYDDIVGDNITIESKDGNTLMTKGQAKNKAHLRGVSYLPFTFQVNYKTLLEAIFMTSSREVTLLIDRDMIYETLLIKGNTTTIAIALETIG